MLVSFAALSADENEGIIIDDLKSMPRLKANMETEREEIDEQMDCEKIMRTFYLSIQVASNAAAAADFISFNSLNFLLASLIEREKKLMKSHKKKSSATANMIAEASLLFVI